MNYKLLAERARYFKETEEGRQTMCKIMEDMRNKTYMEAALEKAKEVYQRCIDEGLLPEQAKRISGIEQAEAAYLAVQ